MARNNDARPRPLIPTQGPQRGRPSRRTIGRAPVKALCAALTPTRWTVSNGLDPSTRCVNVNRYVHPILPQLFGTGSTCLFESLASLTNARRLYHDDFLVVDQPEQLRAVRDRPVLTFFARSELVRLRLPILVLVIRRFVSPGNRAISGRMPTYSAQAPNKSAKSWQVPRRWPTTSLCVRTTCPTDRLEVPSNSGLPGGEIYEIPFW